MLDGPGLAWLLRRAADLSGDGNGGDRGESDAFAIFNDAQDHLLRTARVHIDRVVLEAFVGAVERCPSPAARALLSRVCDMYVLASIEGDLAWQVPGPRAADRGPGQVRDRYRQRPL